MTYLDSLSRIKRNINPKFWNTEDIEHYNNIVNAIEKQIPKKPYLDNENGIYETEHCPFCHRRLFPNDHHCRCGQAIDWSEVENT